MVRDGPVSSRCLPWHYSVSPLKLKACTFTYTPDWNIIWKCKLTKILCCRNRNHQVLTLLASFGTYLVSYCQITTQAFVSHSRQLWLVLFSIIINTHIMFTICNNPYFALQIELSFILCFNTSYGIPVFNIKHLQNMNSKTKSHKSVFTDSWEDQAWMSNCAIVCQTPCIYMVLCALLWA